MPRKPAASTKLTLSQTPSHVTTTLGQLNKIVTSAAPKPVAAAKSEAINDKVSEFEDGINDKDLLSLNLPENVPVVDTIDWSDVGSMRRSSPLASTASEHESDSDADMLLEGSSPQALHDTLPPTLLLKSVEAGIVDGTNPPAIDFSETASTNHRSSPSGLSRASKMTTAAPNLQATEAPKPLMGLAKGKRRVSPRLALQETQSSQHSTNNGVDPFDIPEDIAVSPEKRASSAEDSTSSVEPDQPDGPVEQFSHIQAAEQSSRESASYESGMTQSRPRKRKQRPKTPLEFDSETQEVKRISRPRKSGKSTAKNPYNGSTTCKSPKSTPKQTTKAPPVHQSTAQQGASAVAEDPQQSAVKGTQKHSFQGSKAAYEKSGCLKHGSLDVPLDDVADCITVAPAEPNQDDIGLDHGKDFQKSHLTSAELSDIASFVISVPGDSVAATQGKGDITNTAGEDMIEPIFEPASLHMTVQTKDENCQEKQWSTVESTQIPSCQPKQLSQRHSVSSQGSPIILSPCVDSPVPSLGHEQDLRHTPCEMISQGKFYEESELLQMKQGIAPQVGVERYASLFAASTTDGLALTDSSVGSSSSSPRKTFVEFLRDNDEPETPLPSPPDKVAVDGASENAKLLLHKIADVSA